MENGIFFALAAVFIISAGIISRFLNLSRMSKKLKALISRRWGKEPEKIKPERFKNISAYFTDKCRLEKQHHIIDNITWNDLDMDRIFMRINNTCSGPGEESLYSLLREPIFDLSVLKERGRLIDFFSGNPGQREKLQYLLLKLGKAEDINVSDYFFEAPHKSSFKGILYNVLGIIGLFSPVFMFINLPLGLMVFIISFGINMTLYYKSKNELGSQLDALSYVVRLINCAKSIIDEDIPELKEYTEQLASSYKKFRSVNKKAFNLLYTTGDVFVEYIKIVSLRELANYESISATLYNNSKDLRILYETLGLIDSMISAASYRESLDGWCIPGFYQASGAMPAKLSFVNAFHPLIKNPVKNSLDAEKSILITGSNASGKSTFIKTMAINAILAQTIYTCLAEEYHTPFFKIFSSMAVRDDIVSSESYYIAEIKSLKRIFLHLEEDIPCLCFIDEVLRGTNTVERIAASSQVLDSLSRSNCICITATHDIELTRILEDHFDNYHFQEQITDKGIEFDYTLYPGKSTTRNAIKLLKFMGYEDSIVTSAEERAQKFLLDGKWEKIV